MRLLKYKVNKFRSIKGTEWIEVDQCTCFVGANEAGKTNLLLSLWKFNPAADATALTRSSITQEMSTLITRNKRASLRYFLS